MLGKCSIRELHPHFKAQFSEIRASVGMRYVGVQGSRKCLLLLPGASHLDIHVYLRQYLQIVLKEATPMNIM